MSKRLGSLLLALCMLLSFAVPAAQAQLAVGVQSEVQNAPLTALSKEGPPALNLGNNGKQVVAPFQVGGSKTADSTEPKAALKASMMQSVGETTYGVASGGGGSSAPVPSVNSPVPGLPQRVTVSAGVYQVISSDKYYRTSGKWPFYLQFTGLAVPGDYTVTVTGEGISKELTGSIISSEIDTNYAIGKTVRGVLFNIPDEAIKAGSEKTLKVQVKDWTQKAIFTAPMEVKTTFVEDVLEVDTLYAGTNKPTFSLHYEISESIPQQDIVSYTLLNSNQQVVAAESESGPKGSFFSSSYYDDRYNAVFGSFGYYQNIKRAIMRSYTDGYPHLYKVKDMPVGKYSLKISSNSGFQAIVPDILEVVDATIISYVTTNPIGYSPASVRGSQFHLGTVVSGALKEELDVRVIDESGKKIASSIESRYDRDYYKYESRSSELSEYNCIYKMQLDEGKSFTQDGMYYIVFTRKDGGSIYYDAYSNYNLSPQKGLCIYDFTFDNSSYNASIRVKTVNAVGGDYIFLLRDVYKSGEILSTTRKIPQEENFTLTFKDGNKQLLQLEPYRQYCIEVYNTSQYTYPNQGNPITRYFFEPQFAGGMSEYAPITIRDSSMKTALPWKTQKIPINIYFSTSYFDIGIEDQYVAILTRQQDWSFVGMAENNALARTLSTKKFGDKEVKYVNLSGMMSLTDPLEDGNYRLQILCESKGIRKTLFDTDVVSVNPAKIYGNEGFWQVFRPGTIDLQMDLAEMNTPYDTSKFTFEMNTLLGEKVAAGALTLADKDDYNRKGGWFNFTAKIPDELPEVYYSLCIKYDGKDIYSFHPSRDEGELLFSRNVYNNLKLISKAIKMKNIYKSSTVSVVEGVATNSPSDAAVTAVLYKATDKENFAAAKAVTLTKENGGAGEYFFTEQNLQGVDRSINYDIVFMSDGKPVHMMKEASIAPREVVPSEDIPAPMVTIQNPYVNTKDIALEIATWDQRITHVRIAESEAAVKSAQPQAIKNTISYTLSEGDGEKTLYIAFDASNGSAVSPAYRIIKGILDTKAPEKPVLDIKTLEITQGVLKTVSAVGSESGLTARMQLFDNSGKAVGEAVLKETQNAEGKYIYKGTLTPDASMSTATKARFYFADKAGNQSEAVEISVSAVAGITVTGILKYNEKTPAAFVNLNLYKVENGRSIYMGDRSTETDGTFEWKALLPGEYRLEAFGNNKYKYLKHAFTVGANASGELGDILFESKYEKVGTLTISVTNEDSAAINDAYVYIYNYDLGLYESKTQGEEGRYQFMDLPYEGAAGTIYRGYISKGNYYQAFTQNIKEETSALSIQVPTLYSIKGTVTDGQNHPVPSVSIEVYSDTARYYGYTGSDGTYTINVKKGDYKVEISKSSKYISTPQTVKVDGDKLNVNFTVSAGVTVTGKVLKGGAPAYKAYVTLSKLNGTYVASGYSTGDGGYVLDGAIKEAGRYKIVISSIMNKNGSALEYRSTPVEFEITQKDISTGSRVTQDLSYTDAGNLAEAFKGIGNAVTSSIHVVRTGSDADIVIKYKNNSAATIPSAEFSAALPEGMSLKAGTTATTITDLAAGEEGRISFTVTVSNPSANYLIVPVKVRIAGVEYDFGAASLEVANITLQGPGMVKTGEEFTVYGEATANSTIAIKDALTGEVLTVTEPKGRWYYAKLRLESSRKVVAEATVNGVTARSSLLEIEANIDPITLKKVNVSSQGSNDLPVNSLIGVRAFTAWVGPDLSGRDINLGCEFGNDAAIKKVTYHFSGMDFVATKNAGSWNAKLAGWGGAGLKTITATVETEGKVFEFIIAEVTLLIDPSGYVYDKETGERISGVTVTLEKLEGGNWIFWDAKPSGQVNPQRADSDGNYGWMVPEGIYRVKASAEGYQPYVTTEDPAIKPITIPPARADVNMGLEPVTRVTGIEISTKDLPLRVGNSEILTAAGKPENAVNSKKIKWSSDHPEIASVDAAGKVTGVSAGTATITAAVGNVKVSCKVEVRKKKDEAPSGGAGSTGGTGGAVPPTTTEPNPQSNTGEKEPAKEVTPPAAKFADLGGYDWAKEAIAVLTEKGIIKGTGENTFAPAEQIKRADYIALMVRMLGLTAEVKDNFDDVTPDQYYYKEVGIAKALGLTSGVGNNRFNPEEAITRQDMFAIAYRIMQMQKLLKAEANPGVLSPFADGANIADYAKAPLAALVSMDLVKGSENRIRPLDNTTRAETAVFIYRLYQLTKN